MTANPSVLLYRRALAEGLLNLGFILGLLQRQPEALETYRRATEIAEALLVEEQNSAYTKNLLSQGLTQRANIHSLVGHPAQALPLARRAVAVVEPIVREQPEKISHASSLSNALRGLGRAEENTGDKAAAIKAYERAAEVDRALADRYPGCRYNLACTLAIMVRITPAERREALSAQSVAELRNAVVAGYSNLANIRIDKDLDSLRERDDFKAFFAEMAEKFPAKK